MKKVAVTGGPSQTICDVTDSRGGAWGPDGTILFTDGTARPLFRVPSSGGKPVQLTKLTGGDPSEGHRAPEFLPDGRHFLFLVIGNKPEATGLQVGSLDGRAPVRLLSDHANGVYLPGAGPGAEGGYLFFLREGTLMALPFDAARLKATAEAFPVAENVALAANILYGAFSAAGRGTLAYWGGGVADNRELVWMDRAGRRLAVLGKPNAFVFYAALSPDEKTVAVSIGASPQTEHLAARFGSRDNDPIYVWIQGFRSCLVSRRQVACLFTSKSLRECHCAQADHGRSGRVAVERNRQRPPRGCFF